MNNRTGNYMPKSRIEKNATTSVKTMGRDEIKVKKVSSKNPKVTRTQFEEEEYEYAKGGGVRKSLFSNREYSYGRNWTNDHRHHNKSEDYEVPMSNRKRKYEDGGGIGTAKPISYSEEEKGLYLVEFSDGENIYVDFTLPDFADQRSEEFIFQQAIHNYEREMEDNFAKGGGVRKVNGREYSYGRNWTNDHRHHNKRENYEVPMSDRKGMFADGGSVNMNKHIWEGWTVGSFIDDLEPQFDMINRGQSWQKPFTTREEVKRWAMDNQPYYKKYIPEVVDYFWAKSQNKNYYEDGGQIDAETQSKIDEIESTVKRFEGFIANIKAKANGKLDAETQAKIDGIELDLVGFRKTASNMKANALAELKAKSTTSVKAEPKATAPAKPRVTAPAKPRVTAPAKPKATAPVKSKSEDVAENLMEVYDDALDGLKVESGSEVYGSIDIQKELKKILDKKITEKSFSKEVGDVLTDENYHSLKNYLALSGLLGKATENEYLGNFKKYKGKGFWNPSVFGIYFGIEVEKEKVAPAKVKAEPKAKTTTPTETKTTAPTETKTTKVKSPSMVTVEGKEIDMDSAEFCDYLLKKFKDRREKSKNAPKKKTPSVMAKITSNVEKSVVQAIKSSVESNKKAIEKNPDFFVKKVEKLESSTKSFLQSMKDVLGDDFKEGEIASTMKHIEELTQSLIEKYKTK
jgi:hypothetical protein